MSGLFHEYCWLIIFYQFQDLRDENGICTAASDDITSCYYHRPFKLLAFFTWNGIIMLLERPLSKVPPFKWITTSYLPLPLVSTMVVLTALPVSHWFTGDWAIGGYFESLAKALWLIKKLD